MFVCVGETGEPQWVGNRVPGWLPVTTARTVLGMYQMVEEGNKEGREGVMECKFSVCDEDKTLTLLLSDRAVLLELLAFCLDFFSLIILAQQAISQRLPSVDMSV